MTPKTWTLTLTQTDERHTVAHDDMPAVLRTLVYGASTPRDAAGHSDDDHALGA